MVKRTARKLLNNYPQLFTDDFEHNKKIVRKLIDIKSKSVKNKVAGYITHLMKIKKKLQKKSE